MPPITAQEFYFSWAVFDQKISQINPSPRLRAMEGQSIFFANYAFHLAGYSTNIYLCGQEKDDM